MPSHVNLTQQQVTLVSHGTRATFLKAELFLRISHRSKRGRATRQRRDQPRNPTLAPPAGNPNHERAPTSIRVQYRTRHVVSDSELERMDNDTRHTTTKRAAYAKSNKNAGRGKTSHMTSYSVPNIYTLTKQQHNSVEFGCRKRLLTHRFGVMVNLALLRFHL